MLTQRIMKEIRRYTGNYIAPFLINQQIYRNLLKLNNFDDISFTFDGFGADIPAELHLMVILDILLRLSAKFDSMKFRQVKAHVRIITNIDYLS